MNNQLPESRHSAVSPYKITFETRERENAGVERDEINPCVGQRSAPRYGFLRTS